MFVLQCYLPHYRDHRPYEYQVVAMLSQFLLCGAMLQTRAPIMIVLYLGVYVILYVYLHRVHWYLEQPKKFDPMYHKKHEGRSRRHRRVQDASVLVVKARDTARRDRTRRL